MATPRTPRPVRLICGMISADESLFGLARERMAAQWGPIDLASEVMDFELTHYYDAEMGHPLRRQFVSFAQLIPPDALAAIKRRTNELEAELAAERSATGGPARPINLDPGYVDESKLVLASMKNFSHRIYLGGGVYGELTLTYHKSGRWDSLPWTFPDYGSGRYHPFFLAVRAALRRSLQEQQS